MAKVNGKAMPLKPITEKDKDKVRYFVESEGNYSQSSDSAENHGIVPIPVKSRDMLSRILTDRLYLIRDEMSEISKQIDERTQLKKSLDSEIEQKVCDVQNIIYFMELDMCNRIDKSRRRSLLEQQIGELYKEKRQGKLSCWQDTVMLQRELRKAEKELRSATLDLWMVRFLS